MCREMTPSGAAVAFSPLGSWWLGWGLGPYPHARPYLGLCVPCHFQCCLRNVDRGSVVFIGCQVD